MQQTTVVHATPYFLAFMARWPTVMDLAEAEDGEVMAAWAGLGYYARARNLLACARAVAGDHGGVFPATEAALLTLPGVGLYTAAAVAAIAFGQPTNVVDGNVERVMARLFAVETPLPGAKSQLHNLAASLVRDQRPGDWAQALMDLGATVCRPKSPSCDNCPVQASCLARKGGDPASFPRRAPKIPRPHRFGIAYRLVDADAVALVRRPTKGLLGGMLGLPTSEWRAHPWSESAALAGAPCAGNWRRVGPIEHVFTHFSLTLDVYEAAARSRLSDFHWTLIPVALMATPSVFRKALGVNSDLRADQS